MTENNNENSKDKEESLFFISSSGLKWQESFKEQISGFYAWEEKVESTGIVDEPKQIKFIKYPFDRYKITVAVSSNNEFIGITEVQLNEDFRNYKQKHISQTSLNVEDFYFEE